MNQIVHIFKKDVRHHWIEIAICQAALVGYTWHEIYEWQIHDLVLGMARFWPVVVYALLPISWWIMIVRVVQSESLVGDRQFWITRPYEWKKLLAAKTLFILAFLSFPLFCAQLFLLVKAGFTPMPYVPGLMWMQLLLIALPFLPLMALAAVARNISQALLVLLAVILFMAGMIALAATVEDSAMSSSDASDWLQAAVAIITCIAAIWLQYRHRKTGRARLFLISGAAVVAIILATAPHLIHEEAEYPLVSTGSGGAFHAALSPVKPQPPKTPPEKDEDVEIEIPIIASGPANGFLAKIRATQLTLETQDGFQWISKWQSSRADLLFPGQSGWIENFKLNYKLFGRMSTAAVKAKVSLAISIYRDQGARRIEAGKGEFEIPQVGRCSVDPKHLSYLECRSPLVKPETVLVVTESASSTCPVPERNEEDQKSTAMPVNTTAAAWEFNGEQGPAEFGIDPVESFTLYLWGRNQDRTHARVCPGTLLTLSFPKFEEHRRVEFEVRELRLNEYRTRPFVFSSFGISVK